MAYNATALEVLKASLARLRELEYEMRNLSVTIGTVQAELELDAYASQAELEQSLGLLSSYAEALQMQVTEIEQSEDNESEGRI